MGNQAFELPAVCNRLDIRPQNRAVILRTGAKTAIPIYSNGCAEAALARWHSSAALTPLWFPGTSTNYPGNLAGMLYGYANDSFY